MVSLRRVLNSHGFRLVAVGKFRHRDGDEIIVDPTKYFLRPSESKWEHIDADGSVLNTGYGAGPLEDYLKKYQRTSVTKATKNDLDMFNDILKVLNKFRFEYVKRLRVFETFHVFKRRQHTITVREDGTWEHSMGGRIKYEGYGDDELNGYLSKMGML